MVLRRFKVSILLQLVAVACVSALFFYLFYLPGLIFTKMLLVLLWLGLLYYLFSYITRHLRELKLFLAAFQHLDTTIKFSEHHKNPDLAGLHEEFNRIISSFAKTREEKQIQQLYLQSTVENVRVGVVAFNQEGDIILINQAAKDLIGLPVIRNIKQLSMVEKGLDTKLWNLKSGEDTMIKLSVGNDIVPLSLRATQFSLQNGPLVTLISMQNIKAELANTEMDAWQKLIKVLRHEIMNSLGAINLLAGSLIKLQKQSKIYPEKSQEFSELQTDISDGLEAIHKRSSGLINFVQKYRQVTNIPAPEFTTFSLQSFMNNFYLLVKVELENKRIEFTYTIDPPDLRLYSDEKLLEQVMINLVKNAIEAVEEVARKHIMVEWLVEEGNIYCKITDSGSGIEKDNLEQIFIPYFTTKINGSGIGLSITRHIMHQLTGDVVAQTSQKSTIFILKF